MGSRSVTPCSAQRLVPCARRVATPNPYGPNVVSLPSCFYTRPDVRVFATKGKFSSFEDMINSYDTVLLDAYATWCGPCQYMASVLKGVSAELKASGVQVIKLDTECVAFSHGSLGFFRLCGYTKSHPYSDRTLAGSIRR